MKKYILLYLLLIGAQARCQDNIDYINKYLAGKDSVEFKIKRLLILAEKDEQQNDFEHEMNKLQIALLLEKQLSKPCSASSSLSGV